MEEVTLRAIQRAMPGNGRARVHNSLLSAIGIEDKTEVEVVTPDGSSLTLTVFADSLVEQGQIRISQDDLKKLGITDGVDVKVRRKIPVSEQVKDAAEELAGKISKGAKEIGDTLSEKTVGIREGTTQAAQEIQEKAREVSAKIAEEVAPLGEKIGEAGRGTAARIKDLVPTARFNAQVEAGLKQLSTDNASELKKMLLEAEGDKHVATVKTATSAGRSIQNLTVPPDVSVIAIQRADNTLVIPKSDTILASDDRVYLAGSDRGLEYMTKILEG